MSSGQWQVGDMGGGGNAPVVGVAGLNKSGTAGHRHASFSSSTEIGFHSRLSHGGEKPFLAAKTFNRRRRREEFILTRRIESSHAVPPHFI